MSHHSHHDPGGGPAAAVSWTVGMIIVLFVAVALLIALLVWAPWDTAEGGDGDDNGVVPEEQSDGENGTDVDIDGDIDLDGDDGDGDGDNQ